MSYLSLVTDGIDTENRTVLTKKAESCCHPKHSGALKANVVPLELRLKDSNTSHRSRIRKILRKNYPLPNNLLHDRYRVGRCLGRGSTGSVYLSRNLDLFGYTIALKILSPEIACDRTAVSRFKKDFIASYLVSHPNIIRAYESFRRDSEVEAFAMEYAGGGTLADLISSSRKIRLDQIIILFSQMVSAVQAMHAEGIIHCNLNAESILLTSKGDIKITNFGDAHISSLPEVIDPLEAADTRIPTVQERPGHDVRTDISAIGAIAYQMITGEYPFPMNSIYQAMTTRVSPKPPHLLKQKCPLEVSQVIIKAMAAKPDEGYQTVDEMAADMLVLNRYYGAPCSVSQKKRKVSRNIKIAKKQHPSLDICAGAEHPSCSFSAVDSRISDTIELHITSDDEIGNRLVPEGSLAQRLSLINFSISRLKDILQQDPKRSFKREKTAAGWIAVLFIVVAGVNLVFENLILSDTPPENNLILQPSDSIAAAEDSQSDQTTIYTVIKGDTIFEIAARFSIPQKDLIRANSIIHPRQLQVGTVLKIPQQRGKENPV